MSQVSLWSLYDDVGSGIVEALSKLGEKATHESVDPEFYPNRIRFPDNIEFTFAVWQDLMTGAPMMVVEISSRIVNRVGSMPWSKVASKMMADVSKIRTHRARIELEELTEKKAAELQAKLDLSGTPFHLTGVKDKICLIMNPTEVNEEQILKMTQAARDCGLVWKAP